MARRVGVEGRQLFFVGALGLVVLSLGAVDKIISVLKQTNMLLVCFLDIGRGHFETFTGDYTKKVFVGSVLLRLCFGVHPGEAEVLDGAHVNFQTDRRDLISVVAQIFPKLLELGSIKFRIFDEESHLDRNFEGALLGDHGTVFDLVVVINLRKVAFKSLVHDTLTVMRDWLHFLDFRFSHFLASLCVCLGSFASHGVNIQKFIDARLARDFLGCLINRRRVSILRRDHVFTRSLMGTLIFLVLQNLLAVWVNRWLVTALLIIHTSHNFLQVLEFLHLMPNLILHKLIGISNSSSLFLCLLQDFLLSFQYKITL